MTFYSLDYDIPMFNEVQKKYQILYPNNKIVIAGGAVRDYLMGKKPKDIDVFFLGLDWTKESRHTFKDRLDAEKMQYEEAHSNLPWHSYERYLLTSIYPKDLSVVAGMELQFMGFPTDSATGLLKTFDWEICLFAYDNGKIITTKEAFELVKAVKTFSPDNKEYKRPVMKLCNVQFPISNLRRGFKFETRYHVELDYDSVLKLCQSVILEHREKGTNEVK